MQAVYDQKKKNKIGDTCKTLVSFIQIWKFITLVIPFVNQNFTQKLNITENVLSIVKQWIKWNVLSYKMENYIPTKIEGFSFFYSFIILIETVWCTHCERVYLLLWLILLEQHIVFFLILCLNITEKAIKLL